MDSKTNDTTDSNNTTESHNGLFWTDNPLPSHYDYKHFHLALVSDELPEALYKAFKNGQFSGQDQLVGDSWLNCPSGCLVWCFDYQTRLW